MQVTMPLVLALALGADRLTAQQAQPGMETRAGEAPVERCVAGAAILNARGGRAERFREYVLCC